LLGEAVERSRADLHRSVRASMQDDAWQRVLRARAAQPDYRERMVAAAALQPVVNQVVMAASAWSTAVERMLANREVQSALQALVEAAREQQEREQHLAAVEKVVDSEDVDLEVINEFDHQVAEDEDFNAVIETAVDRLVERHPRLTRVRARRVVIYTVYLVWLGTLLGFSMFPAGMFSAR
jgi:hypothetical protein